MDVTIQASSGMMSVTGMPDGPPMRAGASIVDFLSGVHLYAGIMTALYERTQTGEGRLVEVAMQDTAYPTLASNLGFTYRGSGALPPRVGNRHGGLALAPYNVYEANDGHIAVVCVTEPHWHKMLAAMGREDLKDDPRFSTNKARVENLSQTDEVVQQWASSRTRDELVALSKQHGFPAAPVRNLIEVMNDPHMHARGMLEWFEDQDLGRIVLPGSPLMIHGADRVSTVSSPKLGQHNQEIYGHWLGMSDAAIEALKKEGTI